MSIHFAYALMLSSFTSLHAGRVLLTLYALKLGADPLAVGVLAAMFSVLPTLLCWQVGRLTDRFGARWMLTIGACGGTLGMLVPYLFPSLPALYVAAVANGLVLAFSAVSVQNLVGLLSEPHRRAANFSNLTLATSGSAFLGPLFSGFMIDHAGNHITTLCIALLTAVPVAMLALWGRSLPSGTGSRPSAGGVRGLVESAGLLRVLVVGSVVMTGFSLFLLYMPVYGNGIGLSASVIGTLLAMYSAAAFSIRLILPRLIARLGEERVLALALLLAATVIPMVPLFQSRAVLTLIAFCFGLGIGCGDPITTMLAFRHSPTGRSGEALGLRLAINNLTGLVIPVVFGAIGSTFGVSPVFWINALMLAAGGAFTFLRNPPQEKGRT